jgi:hypothetical protein
MASNGTWSVIFDDKIVVKKSGDMANTPTGYKINDDAFWNQSKFSNIWAIQYGAGTNSVEYRDETPHSEYDQNVLGNFQDFITKWDSVHLVKLQSDWDSNNEYDTDGNPETEAEKIARLGARPTSYSS